MQQLELFSLSHPGNSPNRWKFLILKDWGGFAPAEKEHRLNSRLKPSINSPTARVLYRDDVVPWVKEVVASTLDYSDFNQRWVETDQGYIYGAHLQPVKNILNAPLTALPVYGTEPGMWVEITVPVVDLVLTQPPSGYWLRTVLKPRIYYGQVFWCDNISQDANGQILYRLSEKKGSLPDYFFAKAEACKPVPPEEMTVLSPDVEDKKIIVNLSPANTFCL